MVSIHYFVDIWIEYWKSIKNKINKASVRVYRPGFHLELIYET